MLSTFVIGLREGVEASLIVGIIAAFLVKQGRPDAMRAMWGGVALAVVICLAFGLGLEVLNSQLPQREQEMLETVVATIAVGFVTYMIVWMRRHARDLKKTIEHHAGSAIASGSVLALIGMAFFAVLREGFETAVFLAAAFESSINPVVSFSGAVLGVAAAVVIGALLYRGGIRINLAKFFRVTGAVLVLVAAGLVSSALHTAHEAGWVNFLQSEALDLSWLLTPGSVQSALGAGMFGIQSKPTVIEVIGWLAYAIPMLAYVLWPQPKKAKAQATPKNTATATPQPA